MTALDPPVAGSARQLVCQFEPTARAGLVALFAVEREIEDSARAGVDHGVAHARLAWWEEECARLGANRPRHPASIALLAALQTVDRPPPDLAGLVHAARWRLAQAAFETRAEFARVTTIWSRSLFALVAQLTCPADPLRDTRLEAFTLRAGAALREIELLACARDHAMRGLAYLPLDELMAAGVTHEALRTAPWPSAVAQLLRGRLAHATSELRAAAGTLAAADRSAAPAALLWADQGARLAGHATAALPIQYAAARFEPLNATWQAWRAARAALQGRLPAALR